MCIFPKPFRAISFLVAPVCILCCLETRSADTQTSGANKKTKTVVEMSEQELRKKYSADLGHIEFVQNQQELGNILKLVGDSVDTLFRNFNDVSAREQIVMRKMSFSGEPMATAQMSFSYLVLARSSEMGIGFTEARANHNGVPAEWPLNDGLLPEERARLSDFVVTSGFAAICKYLHPSHQPGSNFRYLGKDRRSPHLLVIAFAQKPEVADFLTSIGGLKGPTPVLLQGLTWVDPTKFQILRMRTDLLEPDVKDHVTSQTTDIQLSEVHFIDISQTFCLPKVVEVSAVIAGVQFLNTHSYSDYKLFRVVTRIK